MEKQRTSADFFTDFDGLMKIHKECLRKWHRILPSIYVRHIGRESNIFTAEDAEEIVNGIKNADRKQLARIPRLMHYLREVLHTFVHRTTDKHNWDIYYPYEEDENFFVDSYTIELNMIPILKQLILDLNNPISSFFGIMRPTEMMSVESISRQKGIPSDVAKFGISPYIGKPPVGGKRTRRRDKRTKSVKRKCGTKKRR